MDVPPPPPPPPPPPAGGDASAQPMELPPHLQDMMREVQANWGGAQHRSRHARASNDSFHGYQQGHNGYGRGGIHGRGRGKGGSRGGRGRGGGRFGRGGYGHQQANQQGYGHYKRKRDDEGSGASRFFLPSFLEDPWASLLQPPAATCPKHEEHRQYEGQRAGRVLFQPSFLMDPWAALVR